MRCDIDWGRLLSVGEGFRCSECKKVVSAECGADDDMPDACDECWNKARPAATIPSIVIDRLVRAADEAVKRHPSACVDDIVRHTAEILGFGLDKACDVCGADIHDGTCSRSPRYRSVDEQHAATLSAHCGARPWDEMAEMSRRLWIERAKRLRKRWAVDEAIERLNYDSGNLALSKENRIKAVVTTAHNLVASWEHNGVSGIASMMYDLRAALEKVE